MIDRSRLVENRRVRQHRDQVDRKQALARAYWTAGTIYGDHGRMEQARKLWDMAAEIDPTLRIPGAVHGRDASRGP
jgi:hypothetical protein